MDSGIMLSPIPAEQIPNSEYVRISPTEEPLVCISDTLGSRMVFQPMYWEKGIHGATPHIYVRKTVADMLLSVADALPAGYKLKIFDAWRPGAVQKALFDEYYQRLQQQYAGSKTPQQLLEMAKCFVSFPSQDPASPFVHATGGAVDLTIVDETGKELDMGTAFDDFTDAAHTAYFENTASVTVRDNRRLLYNLMRSAGFTNFPSEWWHYDYGDRFWAAFHNTNSIYHGIYRLPQPDTL